VTRRAGFTLIEVLAVVLLTGLVIGVALDFYLDLSRASNRAAEHTRGTRRAAAVLDRMARDFEGAVMITKPDDVDPIAHPWVFVAESRGSELGADHVKFLTRNHEPRGSLTPESDLAMVAYSLRRGEDGGLELWRWESPRLPESLDREFPVRGAEGEMLLADGIGAFGMAFMDEALQRKTTWDSSTLVDSSSLPVMVELQLAMAEGDEPRPLEEMSVYRRRVLLLVRPIDLQKLLDPQSAENEDDDGEGEDGDQLASKTVCDCIDCGVASANPSTAALLQEIGAQPAAMWLPRLPGHLQSMVQPQCR
jgi:prepilin-type N-terminal cleavage/methylation domain-containing protein